MSKVKEKEKEKCLSVCLHLSITANYIYLANYMYLSTSYCLVLAALLDECCYNPSMFIKSLGRQAGRQNQRKGISGGGVRIPEYKPNPFRHTCTYPQLHTLPTYLHVPLPIYD